MIINKQYIKKLRDIVVCNFVVNNKYRFKNKIIIK